MAKLVATTALLQCSFGAAPVTLVVPPVGCVLAENKPAATIMDHAPAANIATFGMCSAPSNPAVIAATSAALGVPTPAPCAPVTAAPWSPGSPTVLIGGKPVLNASCKCTCAWGGVISVAVPGSATVDTP